MDTLMSAIESIAVLVAGLAIRMGLLLVVLAVLSIPVMLFLAGVRGVDALRRRLAGVMRVGHLFWSDNVYYAPGHTWVAADRPAARAGRRRRPGAAPVPGADRASRCRRPARSCAPSEPVGEIRDDGPPRRARVAGHRHRHPRQPGGRAKTRRWCTATRTRAAGCSR